MKTLITILFICSLQNVFAVSPTYYVSNSGNDANNGTSPSTPWQTIAKVNSTTFSPGDQILFNSGDTFYGSIIVSNSGNSLNPITYGAYGSGAKPIITGFTTVSSWTNLGSNIWESTSDVSTLSTCNMVVINGVNTPMGRYPNSGYLTYQSHVGSTSITSSSLTGSPNWTGADVAVRTDRSTIQRRNITSQSAGTLNFTAMDWAGTDGYGFFIENDARTLDAQNEWYYNPSTKKIQIYSTVSPANVSVAIIDTLVNLGASKYITINGLDIIGANKYLVFGLNGQNISVTNCNLSFSGDWSIAIYGGSYSKILNNTITDASDGMYISRNGSGLPTYDTISNNVIKRTNIIPGVVPNSNGSGGIRCYSSDNSVIQYNNIDSSGYNGIFIKYANVQVRNNFIKNSCLVIDDGGAIYTGFAGNTGKIIDGNIIVNSLGNYDGTNNTVLSGNGIYIDDNGNHTTVTNNSVTNAGGSGLFLHGANNITVRNNTFYNNGTGGYNKGGLFMQESSLDSNMVNNIIVNNIFLNPNSSQVTVFMDSYRGIAALKLMATLDSNYYCIPISGDANTITIYNSDNGTYPYYNLSGWKTFYGQDAHSHASPRSITDVNDLRFEYNATTSSKTIALDAVYEDLTGTSYNGSITLAPFTSAVLIKNGVLPITNALILYGNYKFITN